MSDDFTNLAAPALAHETTIQLMAPLGLVPGNYLLLGNSGGEMAKVVDVDESGLLVTVMRGVKGPVRALSLLDHVQVVRTYEQGYEDGYAIGHREGEGCRQADWSAALSEVLPDDMSADDPSAVADYIKYLQIDDA